jgi:hypothetical protein
MSNKSKTEKLLSKKITQTIKKKLPERKMEACVINRVKVSIDNPMEELQITQEVQKITKILPTNVTSQMTVEQAGLKKDSRKIMQVTICLTHTRALI